MEKLNLKNNKSARRAFMGMALGGLIFGIGFAFNSEGLSIVGKLILYGSMIWAGIAILIAQRKQKKSTQI